MFETIEHIFLFFIIICSSIVALSFLLPWLYKKLSFLDNFNNDIKPKKYEYKKVQSIKKEVKLEEPLKFDFLDLEDNKLPEFDEIEEFKDMYTYEDIHVTVNLKIKGGQ